MPSHNKVAPVTKKNEADFFVTLEHFECILYWIAGILYLLFCNFPLKRAPAIVSASGFTKSVTLWAPTHLGDGHMPVSDRGLYPSAGGGGGMEGCEG